MPCLAISFWTVFNSSTRPVAAAPSLERVRVGPADELVQVPADQRVTAARDWSLAARSG